MTSRRYATMKSVKPQPVPAIIRAAIERVTGDPHQARREVVQAIIDDLAAAGLAIVPRPKATRSEPHRPRHA